MVDCRKECRSGEHCTGAGAVKDRPSCFERRDPKDGEASLLAYANIPKFSECKTCWHYNGSQRFCGSNIKCERELNGGLPSEFKIDGVPSPSTSQGISGKGIKGVSKDAPKITNEHGGGQSAVSYGFDCLDPKAMFQMTEALEEGRKEYGKDNWRKIPVDDHLNHLMIHVMAYMAGDRQDDHLGHAMCRAMFACAVDLENKERNERKRGQK
jgi:hypothetical protein